jgi:hypothetical protein
MRWFRSKLYLGSRLALFALAVQLVFSFGHVHLHHAASATTNSATIGSGPVLLSERAPGHNPDAALDADCPICALLQMAIASVPSTAPVLPLPAHPDATGMLPHSELALASSPQSLFQARAPPSA